MKHRGAFAEGKATGGVSLQDPIGEAMFCFTKIPSVFPVALTENNALVKIYIVFIHTQWCHYFYIQYNTQDKVSAGR